MLRKRLYRATATFLAAVWLYGAGLQFAEINHPFADDWACGDVALGPQQGTSAKVGVSVTAKGDGHCAVCHLQRTFSHALLLAPSAIRDLGPTLSDSSPIQLVPVTQYSQYSSSRAPPAV
jgi:hypothetical protein